MFGLKLLFMFTITYVYCGHLTLEENKRLQSICGKQKLPSSIQRKSFGGEQMKLNDVPWSALIRRADSKGSCSGSLISNRHVLTAAHCVVDVLGRENRSSTVVSLAFINLGGECVTLQSCSNMPVSYYVETITFPSLYLNDVSGALDIAILELDKNVPESEATPLCIARKDAALPNYIFGVGYGRDLRNPEKSGSLQSFKLTFKGELDALYYDSINYTQLVDQGDSGSAGLQIRSDGSYEIVGVVAMVTNPKLTLDKKIIGSTKLPDIRKLSDWICLHSGVCPDKSKDELMKYLLFHPEASVNNMVAREKNSGTEYYKNVSPIRSAQCFSPTYASKTPAKTINKQRILKSRIVHLHLLNSVELFIFISQ